MTNPAGESPIVNRQSSLPLRVLLIEDSEDDARLILRALTQAGYQPDHLRVQTAESLKQALRAREWDVVLSDYIMPEFSGPDALEVLKQSGRGGEPPDLPFIIVSGAIGEDTAVALMKAGAHDYVMKDKLSRLAPAVAREINEALSRRERRRAELALRESEERYRTLAETARDYIYMIGPDARVEYVNSTAAAELGHKPAEITGKTLSELFPPSVAERQWHNVKTVFDFGAPLYIQNRTDFPRRERSVKTLWLDTWLAPVRDEQGRVHSVVGISRNVTQLVQTELALRTSEERYRLLFENAPIGIYRTAPDGRILMANPALIRMMGCTSFYELSLMNLDAEAGANPRAGPGYDRRRFLEAIERTGQVRGLETRDHRRDGTVLYIRENARAVRDAQGKTLYYEGTVEDITDQHRTQDQLQHANTVLRAVRNISKLIARQRNPDRLIQQICRVLVDSRNYAYAWIARFNPQATDPLDHSRARPQYLTAAQAGFDAEFPELVARLKAGDLPPCVGRALDREGAQVKDSVCAGANPEAPGAGSPGFVARLAHGGRVYGVISVAVAPGVAPDSEEQSLFGEVADDLGYALHALDLEQVSARSRAALQESETRYREIFERALDVIYVHDLQGRFLTINPAGEQLLGYSQDELRRITIADVAHPDSLALVRQKVQEKVQGKTAQTAYELLVRTKTGETLYVELVSRVIIEDGKPVAIQGHARDITRRRAAELASRESEQRYRSLVELSPDAIAVHVQGKVVYANPAALRLVRAETESQLLGKQLLDFVHPDCRELVIQRVKTMSTKGVQVPLTEEKFLRLDGSVIDVEVAAMAITYPATSDESQATSPNLVPAILVVFRDVSERKQADNALRESEARYRLLFEATPIGIAVFHPDGSIIAVNEFMQDLSGYAYADFKQLGVGAIFLDPDERNRLFEATSRLPGSNEKPQAAGLRDWEMRLRRKDGSTRYALLNVDRLEVGTNSILLASARDVTDRKQAELRLLRLNRLYAVLSQANQAFVRERDIQRLCQEACRILVQAGGYRLAWVGVVDQDRRELKPIAQFGDDQGYVDRLRILIGRPGAHGPTATAVLEGRAIVRSDLETLPWDLPHHVEAAEQGLRAVAAFPLRASDEVIGAISIYASESNYFDAEQLHLLEALAADLSFAIQSAQLEEYRRAEEARE